MTEEENEEQMVGLGQESENNAMNRGIPPKKKLTYDNNEDEVSAK